MSMSAQTEIQWGEIGAVKNSLDWKEYKLGSLTSKIGSGATPRGGSNVYKESGISLIRSQNVLDFKFSDSGLAFIDEEQAYELRNVIVQENDILLNITGDSVARCCIVDKEYLPARVNQHVAIIRPYEDKADYRFVFYYLQYLKPELLIGAEVGATRNAITKATIEEIDILLPSLAEQQAIADVLSSLDDKIELLHSQNATIEALAETLFRQWFVEDAKEEWEEKSLSAIATFLNGLACQKYLPKNELDKLPVLKIKDLRNGFSDDHDWATTDVKPEYIVENGDVIFAWSASLMVKIWDGVKCILNQHLFKVTSNAYPKWFYYYWCKLHLQNFISISESHATTMGHIKRGDLDEALVVVPSPLELGEMDARIAPLLEKIIANNRQLSIATNLRNTLLPKLMCGEIRVIK